MVGQTSMHMYLSPMRLRAGALTVNLLAYVTALWSMVEVVKSRDGKKFIGSLGAHT